MQILPFLSIFIILLASLSYTLFSKSATLREETKIATSYIHLERKLLGKLHKEAFAAIPQKQGKDKKEAVAKEVKKSPREGSLAKINLFPLLTTKDCAEEKALLVRCLRSLYGNTLFSFPEYSSISLEDFVDELLSRGQEKLALYKESEQELELLSFTDLYPEPSLKRSLFYKMLKGTHGSYPPLESYASLDSSSSFLIHFPSLSPSMLELIFGKELAVAIVDKEAAFTAEQPERHKKALSHAELSALLQEKHFPTYEKLLKSIDFATKRKKSSPLTVCDQRTHVVLEKRRL